MFDIGMAEMVVIGVVALIVVGPKDLPIMFRRVGQFVGKMRGMAREFQRAMDQAADDSGLKDVADTVKTATSMKNLGLDDAAKSLAKVNEDFRAQQDIKKVDAAAEHKKRQEAVEAANKAAEAWPPEGVETSASDAKAEAGKAGAPGAEAATAAKPPAKKTLAKKAPAKKAPTKKTVAKKAATKPAATKKAPAKKKPAPKKAADNPTSDKA